MSDKAPKVRRVHVFGDVGPAKVMAVEDENGSPKLAVGVEVKEGQPLVPGLPVSHLEINACGCGTITDLYDVPHAGPARVATPAYRKGWDAIKWN